MPPLCCGCSCTIYTNDFSAALSGFTTTGSPSTSGGLLVMTAGDRVIATTTPSSASDSIHLATGALTTDATATLRLICAWVDSSNYLFGEVSRAAGAITLRLGQVAGGVSTWLTDAVTVQDTGAELDERHVITLCWTPGPVLEEEAVEQSLLPWRADDSGGDWSDESEILEYEASAATSGFGVGEAETDIILASFQFAFAPGFVPEEVAVGWQADHSPVDPVDVTDSFAQLFDDSGFVGTNQATEAYSLGENGIDPVTNGGYDPLDTWDATLTDEIVNSATFGVGLRFKRSDTDFGSTVNLYHVTMTVRGTMPERRVGRLTLAYGNSSVAETDCVTDYSAVLTGDGLDGKAAGLAVTAGDWDFDAFTLSYLLSDSRPTCPSCGCTVDDAAEPCECCDPAFPPAQEYTVDIGTPGMTDNECDGCDQISGTYVLSGEAACFWRYEEVLGTCDGPLGERPGILTMTLALVPKDGGGCKWTAMLSYASTFVQDPSNPQQSAELAFYELDMASDEDCQDPATLNLITAGGNACTGSFPATIDIAPV
jgi:hypothetical protein